MSEEPKENFKTKSIGQVLEAIIAKHNRLVSLVGQLKQDEVGQCFITVGDTVEILGVKEENAGDA